MKLLGRGARNEIVWRGKRKREQRGTGERKKGAKNKVLDRRGGAARRGGGAAEHAARLACAPTGGPGSKVNARNRYEMKWSIRRRPARARHGALTAAAVTQRVPEKTKK